MQFNLYLYQGLILSKEATKFLLKDKNGEVVIMDKHIPIVLSALEATLVLTLKNNETKYICLERGIIEFKQNTAKVLASLAVVRDSEKEAQTAFLEAKNTALNNAKKENNEFTILEKKLKDQIHLTKAGSL